jgi:hypothetical protein
VSSSFFYTEIQVPKPNTSCTNRFKNIDEFLSFQRQFIGLNENTIDHNYPNSKICSYRFWDGILMCRFMN